MFSMSALPVSLESVLRTARVVRGIEAREKDVLCTHWEELDGALPDGGFPRGLVELTAPNGLGGSVSIALSAIAALHASHPDAHAAWLESPEACLSAPAALERKIDLSRLFVVRADRDGRDGRAGRDGVQGGQLSRAAVKVVESGAFGVVCVRGARFSEREARRVQLAAEESSCVVFALVDSYESHAPWPSVLRLSLTRAPAAIHVHVVRERRGRVGQRATLRAA